MRILLMHDGHRFGGLERVMADSARRLAAENDLGAIVRGPSFGELRSADPLTAALYAAGVDIIELERPSSAARPLAAAQRTRALRTAIRVYRPDVFHIHTVKVESARPAEIAARLAGVGAIVRTEHNSPDAFSREPYSSLRRRCTDRLVSRFVTVSEADRTEQIERVGRPATKVVCVRNGVDVDQFDPRRTRPSRTALGLPEDALVVGTAGRLSDQKGQHLLVDALATGHESLGDVHLAIAGDGPLASELRSRATANGVADRVHFLGQVDDMVSFYASVDVGAMPSLHEGLSLTLLEMMSMALPTVVTDHPGLTEAAVHELTSLVVPVGDTAGLAAALARLSTDEALRRRFAAAAQERAVADFSYERYIAELTSMYGDVVRTRSG